MHGRPLSYEEHLEIALKMFREDELQDLAEWDGGANTALGLSENEEGIFKALIELRNAGCIQVLTEEGPNGRKLSKLGAELCEKLLEFAGKLPRVAPESVFWALHKAVLMVPMECVIVRPSIDEAEETLLARRESNDPFFPGEEWHSPGAIMGVGETHLAAVRRCVTRETGCTVKRLMAVAANNVPNFRRGHERSQIWVVELADNPASETMEKQRLGWFRLDNLPGNLLHCHVPIHAKVNEWLTYFRSLPNQEEKRRFLKATCPIESDEK